MSQRRQRATTGLCKTQKDNDKIGRDQNASGLEYLGDLQGMCY